VLSSRLRQVREAMREHAWELCWTRHTTTAQSRWLVSLPPLHTPYPRHPRRSARGKSGQHGGIDPNFPTYSPRTSKPPAGSHTFMQVTGLRPTLRKTDTSTQF
jgi:hypothetical protein